MVGHTMKSITHLHSQRRACVEPRRPAVAANSPRIPDPIVLGKLDWTGRNPGRGGGRDLRRMGYREF
jgi:hypothetical protein